MVFQGRVSSVGASRYVAGRATRGRGDGIEERGAEKRAKVWLWLRAVPLPGEVFQVFRVLRAGTAEVKGNEVGTSEVTFLLQGGASRDLSDGQGGRAAS